MHACNLANELGTRTVLVPRGAGVLSALGLAVSDLRRDYVAALYAGVAELDLNVLENAYAALERRARADLAQPTLRRSADLRYRGQSFELTVPADEPGHLVDNFAASHRRRFGFELAGEDVQIVSIRLAAVVPVPKPRIPLLADSYGVGGAPAGHRRAYFAGTWTDVAVYQGIGHLGRGHTVKGPVIVDLPEATCVVPPGWRALVDDAGALVLESS
jgi:N-methylhydantoinase A